MEPTTELIIERPDGSRYGVRDIATAERLHPGFTVISYADGRPFEKPKRKRGASVGPVTSETDPATEEQGNVAE